MVNLYRRNFLNTSIGIRTLLLPALLLASEGCHSQNTNDSLHNRDAYVTNAESLNKGVYKTFDEFKYNRPSITQNYIFDKKKFWLTDSNTGKRTKIKKREIWGFCDGSKSFVKWSKFNEIVQIGRYCYFMEKGTRIINVASPLMFVPIPVRYKDELIINFNTGTTYLLTKKLMKQILRTDDPELLAQFMLEPKKRKKLFDYIVKYNDRNTAKIK
jgi:hypothetical protein